MATDTTTQIPYRPNFIHTFYAWLGRLPIPDWLLLVLLIPIVGIVQHLVAWSRGMLARGQFNYDLGTAGIYIGGLLAGLYVLKGAPKALEEYRPLIEVSDEEYAGLRYRFITIPRRMGTLIFLLAAAFGTVSGFTDRAVAPEVDYAFPQLRMAIWAFGTGIFFVFVYQVVRQLRQIGAFYAMPERIDVFNQRPLYGFSRYTATIGLILFIYFVLTLFDPTAYDSQVVFFSGLLVIPAVLLIFYLPLSGAHQRLVSEKDRMLQEANSHIATILKRIHLAAFERQDYEDVGGLRTVLSTLREEKETIQGLSTWPWRPGIFTGLLSALLLPVILLSIREIIVRLLES